MLKLELLAKILFKPKEAFEELAGYSTVKEGLLVWFFMNFLALMVFGGVLRSTGFAVVTVNFGFTEISAMGIAMGFLSGIVVLFILALVISLLAGKWGGESNFRETLVMFGYAEVIAIIQAIAAVVVSLVLYVKIGYANSLSVTGGVVDMNLVFNSVIKITVVANLALGLWYFWIIARAASTANKITIPKTIVILVTTIILISQLSRLALLV